MNFVALNGWNYSIAHHLPGIVCPPELHWTRRKAMDLARDIREPTVLIGFSRGANAALACAQNCPHVVAVYAHSCTFRPHTRKRLFDLTLFRTFGDQFPTFEGTGKTYSHYYGLGYGIELINLDPVPWKPRTYTERLMHRADHQFHNCIPILKKRGVL